MCIFTLGAKGRVAAISGLSVGANLALPVLKVHGGGTGVLVGTASGVG